MTSESHIFQFVSGTATMRQTGANGSYDLEKRTDQFVVFTPTGLNNKAQGRERSERTLGILYKYLNGICANLNSPIVEVGGVADHIHILCRMSSGVTVQKLILELKRDSSKYVKTLAPELSEFFWQAGYGAFSVSPSHVPRLIQYIKNQAEHHRKESFQDEFRRLLRKYEIEFDERYVWD